MEEIITAQDAIQIFDQRRKDLEQYSRINLDEIQSYNERAKTEFRQRTYELNDRLCRMMKEKLS